MNTNSLKGKLTIKAAGSITTQLKDMVKYLEKIFTYKTQILIESRSDRTLLLHFIQYSQGFLSKGIARVLETLIISICAD